MTWLRNIQSAAKINLFLHITGQRTDGYHLLQSAFMYVNYYDILHFHRTNDGKISRQDLTVQLPEEDLCIKAAKALQQRFKVKYGAHIQLEKHIPTQAGLGGGSSNAASCLLALTKLWQLPATQQDLQQIATTLGADVAFFLQPNHAWVEGIGEQITPIQLPYTDVLICKPNTGIATSSIFNHPKLNRNSSTITKQQFLAQPFTLGHNDLQPIAQQLNPQIAQAIDFLQQHKLSARMSGSGSSVFAILDTPEKLHTAKNILQLKHNFLLKICNNLVFNKTVS